MTKSMTLNFNSAALDLGKKKLSPQTKFLHYFPKKDAVEHHTIPLFENFAFVLSLFRSKEIDNIEIALDILEKCLGFQTDIGAFPRFIHEYPIDHLYLYGIDILNTLYWLVKEFKKVMSNSLKEKLDSTITSLISFCEIKKSFFPKSSLLRFEVLKSAIKGTSFNFEESFSPEFICSKEGLKDVFLSLQIYDLENKEQFTKDLWESSLNLYHRNLSSYVGPADHIFQNQYKAELHLSDLFFLALHKTQVDIDLNDPIFLSASLLRPIINIKPSNYGDGTQETRSQVDSSYEDKSFEDRSCICFEKEDKKWICCKDKYYCLTSVERTLPIDKMFFGFHLFKAIFGDSSKINSLVCQHFEGEYLCKIDENGGAELEFIFPEDIKEDEFELKFFVENQDCQIFVNDTKATAFDFKDRITLKNDGAKVCLTFDLLDKEARFCGHILRGNRPSQLAFRKDKFMAYDYMISFRTIRRPTRCRIKAKLEFYSS